MSHRVLGLALALLLAGAGPVQAETRAADDREILHALNRLTFGPRPGDVERVRAVGHFVYRRVMHDTGEKTVLGHRLRAGGGQEDGERVIEILTGHPSTARLIVTKLVRRFVADEPPRALVERVEGRDLAVTTDFRALFTEVAAHHLGVPPAPLFPGFKPTAPALGLFT